MEKIKSFLNSDPGKDLLIIIIVILASLASFELGRLSKDTAPKTLKIEYSGPINELQY